ncbi:MAG: hypothetical protein V3U98_10845 [Acidobacteriota bacterium]
MNRAVRWGVVALFFAVAIHTREVADTSIETWWFDKDHLGRVAVGWVEVTGTWQVVADPTAPSTRNVFAQVSKEHSGSYFNVAIANELSLKEVVISVQLRAIAGQEDQGGGPVWRYQDIKNYYVARHNPLEDNYRVYKVVDGRRIQLGSADLKASRADWHDLTITMTGDLIRCFFDVKKYLEVKDGTFQEAGKVGLWTKADAQTHFNNFRVEGK